MRDAMLGDVRRSTVARKSETSFSARFMIESAHVVAMPLKSSLARAGEVSDSRLTRSKAASQSSIVHEPFASRRTAQSASAAETDAMGADCRARCRSL